MLHKYKNNDTRIYILYASASVVIFIVLLLGFILYEEHARIENGLKTASMITDELVFRTRRIMDHYTRILQVVSQNSLFVFKSGNTLDTDEIADYFERIAGLVPSFLQIRYLDETGQEVVRINRKGNSVIRVPKEKLQNKKGRYYFQKTRSLPAGQVFVSDLDLNVEDGRIEEPGIPTMRLAIPLYDSDTSFRGIIIVNVDTSSVTGLFAKQNENSIYLINKDGYYIAGADDDMLYGFMFDGTNRVSEIQPKLWRMINRKDAGYMRSGEKLYVFATMYPVSLMQLNEGMYTNAMPVKWTVVMESSAFVPEVVHSPRYVLFFSGALVTLLLAGYLLSTIHINRKKLLRSQEQSASRLVKLDRLASVGTLVAGISHELNTPIGNSITIISTLEEKQRDFISSITNGEVRKSVINKYLFESYTALELVRLNMDNASQLIEHFKQIASARTADVRRKIDLSTFLPEITEMLKSTLSGGNIQLKTHVPKSVVLYTYPGDLYQVIHNIVNNAVSHGLLNRNGIITISAHVQDNEYAKICIIDNGTGISPDILPHVFKPFYSTRMGQSGSGLGLHIVDNIVTGILGGSVDVMSKHGQWTRFCITLPFYAPDHGTGKKETQHAV